MTHHTRKYHIPNLPFLPTVYEDLRVLGVHDPSAYHLFIHLARPGFRAVFLYRIAAWLHVRGPIAKIAASLVRNINMAMHGCSIWPHAVIGPGLRLPHPAGIEIGYSCIGHHVTILQRVTFGLRYADNGKPTHEGRPLVGDHVVISAGAVVTGDVKIGDYAIIGPNAVVLEDVPSHGSVTGDSVSLMMDQSQKAA